MEKPDNSPEVSLMRHVRMYGVTIDDIARAMALISTEYNKFHSDETRREHYRIEAVRLMQKAVLMNIERQKREIAAEKAAGAPK